MKIKNNYFSGYSRFFLLIVLIVLFVIAVLTNTKFLKNYVSDHVQKTINGSEGLYGDERDFWGERIAEIGAFEAYNELKAKYGPLDYGKQHAAAHLFGDVLYKEKGADGLSTCDEAFEFGCFHAFIGQMINDEGLESVKTFDRICAEGGSDKFGVCHHGIGHGILSYLGAEESNINEALNVCGELSWTNPLGGCAGGVFMEYNFRTMDDPAGSVFVRPIGDDLFSPCNKIQERFLQQCYFDQAHWWVRVLDGDYQKAGSLCGSVQVPDERRACFLGMGSSVASHSTYDVEETIAKCFLMPGDAEAVCRAGAASIFSSLPQYKNLASRVCESKDTTIKEICLNEISTKN